MLLVHGDQDRLVPVQQSRLLFQRLQAMGSESQLVVREGKDHAWPGWESESSLIADWFDAALAAGQRAQRQ